MDARIRRLALVAPALLVLGVSSFGATYSTTNFVVTAPTPEFAQDVAETAERCRTELSRAWLNKTLDPWFRPCQVSVTVGQIGAGGATTFTFAAGHVFGWNMKVQGTAERILDSVIPHEVSHTIFASYFRRPLPRWADEGAATLVEHESERHRQQLLLKQVFNSPQRIPLSKLISMKEYPADMQSVLTLYAEGYSLADYLVQSGGKDLYLKFLNDGQRDWNYAIKKNYGLPNVASLEQRWSNWVMAGSPELQSPESQMLAQNEMRTQRKDVIVRSQSPDGIGLGESDRQPQPVAHQARPLARGAALTAPDPAEVQGRAAGPDGAHSSPANVDAGQVAMRRREARTRLLNEGWHPVLIERNAPARSVRDEEEQPAAQKTADASVRTDESPARRHFRDAQSAQDQAEQESVAEPSPVADPPAPTANEIAAAQTDFHVEK